MARTSLFLLLLLACGEPGSQRALEVCARGDRALLAAAIEGGRLEVRIEQGGEVVSHGDVPAGDGERLEIDLPDGAATVVVIGIDGDGDEVASGTATLDQAGACVCLALSAQAAAACGGIDCQVVGDTCRFIDADSGAPAGRQQLTLAPAQDTWLDAAAPGDVHGDDDMLEVGPDGTALLAFDLSGLPVGATIEQASLRIVRLDASTARPVANRITSGWSADATTFADAPSYDAAPIASDPGGSDHLTYDLSDDVTRWVNAADANPNFGIALTQSASITSFGSSESGADAAPVLEIEYSVEAMGVLPAAIFERGCAATCDPGEDEGAADGCGCDEQPVHQVSLSEFEFDRTEVTQAAYRACVDDGACTAPPSSGNCLWDPDDHPGHPVACVTWDEARAYCEWSDKRLPSEAEWERAAAGSRGDRYPWGNDIPTCELANSFYCSPGDPVGAKRDDVARRPDGVSIEGTAEVALDTAGNLLEWVADVYDPSYYGALAEGGDPAIDPTGPETGDQRALRGGYYYSGEWLLRTGNRDHGTPDARDARVGFRCAR